MTMSAAAPKAYAALVSSHTSLVARSVSAVTCDIMVCWVSSTLGIESAAVQVDKVAFCGPELAERGAVCGLRRGHAPVLCCDPHLSRRRVAGETGPPGHCADSHWHACIDTAGALQACMQQGLAACYRTVALFWHGLHGVRWCCGADAMAHGALISRHGL